MKDDTFLYIRLFILLYEVETSVVCERWRQGQTKTDCYIDSLLLLLTIARCVIFKTPLSTTPASWPELLNWKPDMGTSPSGVLSVTASWL